MGEPDDRIRSLYCARRGRVEFVDVPALNYVVLPGKGDPTGAGFAEAVEAVFAVSYAAHFVVRRRTGSAPRIMPLEALWWADDPAQVDLLAAVALGVADLNTADRRAWRWQAMIMQPAGIDERAFEQAVLIARKKDLPGVDDIRFARLDEGRAAQVLHVGPNAQEVPTIVALHDAIDAAGCRPRGRHHEIYLNDARRTPPERLRTLLRQPVGPA